MSKNPDYCPDWFDIKNYEPCEGFTRAAWSHVLIPRIFIYNNFCRDESRKEDAEYFIQILQLCTTLEAMNKYNSDFYDHDLKDVTDSAIRDFVIYDFCRIYAHISEFLPPLIPYMNECIENARILNKEDENRNSGWMDMFHEEDLGIGEFAPIILEDELNPYIDIDLRANDEKIIEDFQDWLNKKRTSQRQSKSDYKRVTDGDIKSFIEYKVLAYIDLFLWGKLSGAPLTQPQIGNLLFPEEYNINLTERVRRSVIPHANRLMKFWFRALE